jgi:hypothetical protein
VLLAIVGADILEGGGGAGAGAGKPDFNGGDVVTVEAEVVAEVDGGGRCGGLSQSVKLREWLEAGTAPTVGSGGWGGNHKDEEEEEEDDDDADDDDGNKSVESNRSFLFMVASIKIDSCSVAEEEEEKSAFAIEEEDELVSLSHFKVASFAFTSSSLSLFRLSDILLLFDRVCLPAPGPLKSISAF